MSQICSGSFVKKERFRCVDELDAKIFFFFGPDPCAWKERQTFVSICIHKMTTVVTHSEQIHRSKTLLLPRNSSFAVSIYCNSVTELWACKLTNSSKEIP